MSKVYVAGHNGMVGSAVTRYLQTQSKYDIVVEDRSKLDLFDFHAVESFFAKTKPEYVVLAAAKVGGIHANKTYVVDFLLDNLKIQNNVIESAYKHGVKKLVFLGSSCIYPRMSPQPIREEYLLTGPLEPTNEPYALAKIAGIRLCQAYRKQYGAHFVSVMPTNLYGINDNFDLQNSHVLPALIRKFHEAKVSNSPTVTVWGSGEPRREFLFVDDLAEAVVMLMETYDGEDHINVGYGSDITIRELAELISKIIGFRGQITWDSSQPDGMPRKLLDCTKIHNMGWEAKTSLEDGIRKTYEWFCSNHS